MSLTIYSFAKQHPRTAPALIAANFNGVKVDFQTIGDNLKGSDNFARSPLGRAPSAKTPDGVGFDQSDAIVRYVARVGHDVGLYGANVNDMAKIDSWIQFTHSDLYGNIMPWIYPIHGYAAFNKAVTEAAKEKTKQTLACVNKHLQNATFLVGERITIADIYMACYVKESFAMIFDPAFRSAFPNVTRWYLTIANQPEFKDIMGEVKLAEKMAVADSKGAAPAKPAKKDAPKKEAKKADKPADKPAAPKKDPVITINPETTFNIEEWKRVYSNADDTRGEAMKWFWENFDNKNWSIWYCNYKFPEDNERKLMTSNLVGGWFQRLDRCRKHCFGSVLIFGDEPKLEISGYWIFPNREMHFAMADCVDFEQYDFRMLEDPTKEKELIEDFFSWEGKFGGRKYTDTAKIFK